MPKTWRLVQFAKNPAKRQGKKDFQSILPTLANSTPKKRPAKGVPKTEENPAEIPALIHTFFSPSLNRNFFPKMSAKLPPNKTAVPSLPTEAPTKWLSQVERRMNGPTLEEMVCSG